MCCPKSKTITGISKAKSQTFPTGTECLDSLTPSSYNKFLHISEVLMSKYRVKGNCSESKRLKLLGMFSLSLHAIVQLYVTDKWTVTGLHSVNHTSQTINCEVQKQTANSEDVYPYIELQRHQNSNECYLKKFSKGPVTSNILKILTKPCAFVILVTLQTYFIIL